MKTVKVHLMDRKYAGKPAGNEFGVISSRITKRVMEIDIDVLAEKVASGRPFTPATFHVQVAVDNIDMFIKF